MKKKPPYVDLGSLPEHDRIATIANQIQQGQIVGFIVETDAKANRYLMQLRTQVPSLIVMARTKGPLDFITVQVRAGVTKP